MNASRAICTLESMAIDMVGTLGRLDKASPIAPVLERQIEAINMAQDALRAVRDLATNENASRISVDRINELMQAEREGRMFIPPCKIGDKAYRICQGNFYSDGKPFIQEMEITEISWKFAHTMNGKKDLGFAIIANGTRYKVSSIGKTVFLSRSEAEKVLEEANGKGN